MAEMIDKGNIEKVKSELNSNSSTSWIDNIDLSNCSLSEYEMEKATELCKKHPSLMEATRLVAAPAEAQTPTFLSSAVFRMAKPERQGKQKKYVVDAVIVADDECSDTDEQEPEKKRSRHSMMEKKGKETKGAKKIKNTILYSDISANNNKYEITTSDVFVVEQLSSNQEEADTKLLLQPVHSLSENADASVVVRSSLDQTTLQKCGCPDGLQRQQRVWIDAAFPEEVEQFLAGEENNIESSDESKDEEFINSNTLLNWKPALIG
eukprot:gene10082-18732_t